MHWPRVHGLAVLAGVWPRATELKIIGTLCALVALEGLAFYLLEFNVFLIMC